MKILSRGYSLTSADGRTVLSAEQVTVSYTHLTLPTTERV